MAHKIQTYVTYLQDCLYSIVFVKIAQGIRPTGVFIFHIFVPSSTPNFTPIGATCHPCGVKTSKSAS